MFKFIKQYAESIAGVEIYPIISLVIFFTFFLVLIVWLWKADKDIISEIEKLPLE